MVLGGLSTGIEVDGGIVVVEMGSLLWFGFRVMNAWLEIPHHYRNAYILEVWRNGCFVT